MSLLRMRAARGIFETECELLETRHSCESLQLHYPLVKALCYKLEGRRFKSRKWWIFLIYLILPAVLWSRGSTQPLTEMSTRTLPGGKKRPAPKADTHLWAECVKMWEPQPLTTLRASTACRGTAFPYWPLQRWCVSIHSCSVETRQRL
jgi:hypothetical protein